jgi:hypothetical protein
MAKKRILLVDDEQSLTTLLKLNLEEFGDYEVRVENWPEDALTAAREFKPDLCCWILSCRAARGNVAAQIDAGIRSSKGTPIVIFPSRPRCGGIRSKGKRRHHLRSPMPGQTGTIDEVHVAMIETCPESKNPLFFPPRAAIFSRHRIGG